MRELLWGARVHASGRRKPVKPGPRAENDGARENGLAGCPISLDDEQLAMIRAAAEPVPADHRGGFLTLVANSLRGRAISGASVKAACAEAQKLYLTITAGTGGKSKYG
jgi:hypothetical protein